MHLSKFQNESYVSCIRMLGRAHLPKVIHISADSSEKTLKPSMMDAGTRNIVRKTNM